MTPLNQSILVSSPIPLPKWYQQLLTRAARFHFKPKQQIVNTIGFCHLQSRPYPPFRQLPFCTDTAAAHCSWQAFRFIIMQPSSCQHSWCEFNHLQSRQRLQHACTIQPITLPVLSWWMVFVGILLFLVCHSHCLRDLIRDVRVNECVRLHRTPQRLPGAHTLPFAIFWPLARRTGKQTFSFALANGRSCPRGFPREPNSAKPFHQPNVPDQLF